MTKTTEENLSQSKYAEHRNVTKGYISRMIKEGRLHLIKGKLNVEMSDAELDNKSNEEKAPNYWAEKALHEKAKRELAELDLKLKQDQLVEVDQVGEGYCHFPIHYDEEYFAMLTAEHCVTRFHKGVARREWVLKKVNKPYKIRRAGSFVSGFK